MTITSITENKLTFCLLKTGSDNLNVCKKREININYRIAGVLQHEI